MPFPNLAATALAALNVTGETLQYRAVSSAVDAQGFATLSPGAWADVPRPFVISHQPDDRRETMPDGDRARGSLLVCLGRTGPGYSGPPIGVGDELRLGSSPSEVWVVSEERTYADRSAHRELVCTLVDG